MLKFKNLFAKKCSAIGMVHLKALPGTPLFSNSVEESVTRACEEVELYLKYDIDALLVENMHDVPYIQSQHFGPEVVTTMTRICTELRRIIPKSMPLGVQVLACGNKEALAIAKACNFNFIRAEGFVFGHVADEGYIDANAGQILRYRKNIHAEDVLVFTDIKKKHSSHAITSDVSLVDTARAAEYFLSDGIILTGPATAEPANEMELEDLKKSTSLPILIGSGVTLDNVDKYLISDALIVGSHLKIDGKWYNALDERRLENFMNKIKRSSVNK